MVRKSNHSRDRDYYLHSIFNMLESITDLMELKRVYQVIKSLIE